MPGLSEESRRAVKPVEHAGMASSLVRPVRRVEGASWNEGARKDVGSRSSALARRLCCRFFFLVRLSPADRLRLPLVAGALAESNPSLAYSLVQSELAPPDALAQSVSLGRSHPPDSASDAASESRASVGGELACAAVVGLLGGEGDGWGSKLKGTSMLSASDSGVRGLEGVDGAGEAEGEAEGDSKPASSRSNASLIAQVNDRPARIDRAASGHIIA